MKTRMSNSKAQKKNRKRANKKHGGEGFEVEEAIGAGSSTAEKRDPVQELRERLAQAKAEKNHDLANKLRQELWITQDLAAGYKPNIASEDRDSQEALSRAAEALASSSAASARLSEAAVSTSSLNTEERKLKTLHKKLDQIQSLKKKQEEGVKLEANQLLKIDSEQSIREDIEHLERLLSIPVKR